MPKRATTPTRVSQTRDLQINFVNAEDLTITRRRSGKGWRYGQADGSRISDREEIARLNRIGLPPAYREGRFCADPSGHIQAVGSDTPVSAALYEIEILVAREVSPIALFHTVSP